MGYDGAGEIARVLLEQGVRFEFVLDEGTTVLQDVVPGLQQPLALWVQFMLPWLKTFLSFNLGLLSEISISVLASWHL